MNINPFITALYHRKGIRKVTLQKYRLIDLAILTGLSVLADTVSGLVGFAGLNLYVAVSVSLLLLGYVRWGKWALAANAVVVIAHFLVYRDQGIPSALAEALSFGALSVALAFPLRRFTRPHPAFGPVVLLFLAAYAAMFALQWGLGWAFGTGIPLVTQSLRHVFNFLFNFGLLAVIAHQKDLFIPMVPYLREEAEKRERENEKKGIGLNDDETL